MRNFTEYSPEVYINVDGTLLKTTNDIPETSRNFVITTSDYQHYYERLEVGEDYLEHETYDRAGASNGDRYMVAVDCSAVFEKVEAVLAGDEVCDLELQACLELIREDRDNH